MFVSRLVLWSVNFIDSWGVCERVDGKAQKLSMNTWQFCGDKRETETAISWIKYLSLFTQGHVRLLLERDAKKEKYNCNVSQVFSWKCRETLYDKFLLFLRLRHMNSRILDPLCYFRFIFLLSHEESGVNVEWNTMARSLILKTSSMCSCFGIHSNHRTCQFAFQCLFIYENSFSRSMINRMRHDGLTLTHVTYFWYYVNDGFLN